MRAFAIYGTRPEWIKLEPVIKALRRDGWTVDEHWTGQSPNLFPEKVPNPRPWNTVGEGVATILNDLSQLQTARDKPDVILVVGDTASAWAGASAGFLADIDVAHVEAGMRTYRHTPHPEEAFRQAIRPFAKWHFCPSQTEVNNVNRERGIRDGSLSDGRVIKVGNTVIDAVREIGGPCMSILCTMHRREHWGVDGVINRTLSALRDIAYIHGEEGVQVTVISHPNWEAANVGHWHKRMEDDSFPEFQIVQPIDYSTMVLWIKHADLIVTDSGGIQEEAAYFGTPTLCVRESTERTGLTAVGSVSLVSPEELQGRITDELEKRWVYGRGNAAGLISGILTNYYGGQNAGA